jgi:hypothetical protein
MPLLNRSEIVALYRCLREAERSFHFVLNPARSWSSFRSYYHPTKLDQIRHVSEAVDGVVEELRPPPKLEELLLSPPPWWRSWVPHLIAPWQRHWSFSDAEIAFITGGLRLLIQLLDRAEKPEPTELIETRQALCQAAQLIEFRCPGLRELKHAQDVAHYDQLPVQPDRLRPVA